MFCPECKSEYQVGYTRCNDCDVDLVDYLEEEPQPQPQEVADYVVIATVSGPLADSQVCSFLEANGIPTQVRAAWRKPYGIDFTPAQILVPPECVIMARELLSKADRGDLEIEEA
jgi:hypothetical protein